MPPSLLIRGRRQQLLLVSMLTCRTGLSSPTLLRSISAGTRTSRRRALRAQSSGSRELQTPASPRPRAAKRWVRRVSKRSARAQIQSPGSFFARHGTLTQWFPEQKSPSFLHVPEDASMGTASRCWTIVFTLLRRPPSRAKFLHFDVSAHMPAPPRSKARARLPRPS